MKTEQEKKSSTLIIRINEQERAIIDQTVKDAGYKSASAYVRDHIAREKPKAKASIAPNTLEILATASAMSALINSNAPKEELHRKLTEITRSALGGLQ